MTHIPAQPSASSNLRRTDNIKIEAENSAKAKSNIATIDNKPKVAAVPATPPTDNSVDLDA